MKKIRLPNGITNKKLLTIMGVLIILYAVVGFILLPFIAQKVLVKNLSQALNRNVTIDDIDLNPFTLELSVTGFAMDTKTPSESPFIAFDRFSLDLKWASLFKLAPILEEVTLKAPYIGISRQTETQYNFSDLLDQNENDTETKEANPDENPFRFAVNNIRIVDGTLRFRDSVKNKTHDITQIQLAIPSLSNFPNDVEVYTEPALSFFVNGTQTNAAVKSKPFTTSLDTHLHLAIKRFQFPDYLNYIPMEVRVTIPSGSVDLDLSLNFDRKNDGTSDIRVEDLNLTLSDLILKQKDHPAPFLKLPLLTIDGVGVNVLDKKIIIDNVKVQKGGIDIVRYQDGLLNLMKLVADTSPDNAAKPEDATKEDSTGDAAEPPWGVVIQKGRIDQFQVRFTDQAPKTPVELVLSDIGIDFQGITNQKGGDGTVRLSLTANKTGKLTLASTLSLTPLAVKAEIKTEQLPLAWLQPYWDDKVAVSLQKGNLSIDGKINVSQSADQNMKTKVTGNITLADISTRIDDSNLDLMQFKTLSVQDLRYQSDPPQLHIKTILLDRLDGRMVVFEDHTTSLTKIKAASEDAPAEPVATPPTQPKPAEDTSPQMALQIDSLAIQNSTFNFTDHSVDPNYDITLYDIDGALKHLATRASSPSDLNLSCNVDKLTPLTLKGQVDLLADALFLDIAIGLKDFNLSPLSPYSGKYIGYQIEKGKLSLDLGYGIDRQKLSATNKVHIDQFTFGKPVESPDAVNLPVNLALALLKDRKGVIQLDVPISGDLSSPQFSIAGIIIDAIKNIIAKAATAPFSLIAGLVGDGTELNELVFRPGSAELEPKALAKLDKITTVLYERPGLKLEITGFVDIEKDKEEIIETRFKEALKKQKSAWTQQKGKSAPSLESIQITPEEYPRVLQQVYLTMQDPAQSTTAHTVKKLPSVEEMRNRVKSRIQVPDGALRILAQNRARNVGAYLIASQKVTPNRLFIVEPQTLAPEKKEDLAATRVEIQLK